MSLPELDTPRLSLRILGSEDVERARRFNAENAAFLAPWEPPVPANSPDVEVLRVVRERAVAEALDGRAYSFALLASGAGPDVPILGWLNFTNVIRGVFLSCVMGYKLHHTMQGHGYMTEAAQAGIDWLFDTMHLHRISANYMPHNQRSAAVLRRLGFRIEGTAKDYLFIGGRWRDHVLTSLVNPAEIVPPGYESAG